MLSNEDVEPRFFSLISGPQNQTNSSRNRSRSAHFSRAKTPPPPPPPPPLPFFTALHSNSIINKQNSLTNFHYTKDYMASNSVKRFLNGMNFSIRFFREEESCRNLGSGILNRYQWSKAENRAEGDELKEKNYDKLGKSSINSDSSMSKCSLPDDDFNNSKKWMPEIAWLAKALEPALQLYKWALPTGNGIGDKLPPTNRSIAEIFASIQRSKLGLQDWSISDLTIGLYLIYLQQASSTVVEDLTGEIISSESIVQDLIYHIELAKGCYRDNAAGLARNSMLRESNVLKFIKNSSVLRPGYYIGIDMRKQLVIFGIRGTHTVYDVITDIVSSSHEEVFEGYTTHFGTAEAATWFLTHEIETIRKCLQKHKGFRLRLVGHSLGGATASILAMMLRKKSHNELGFSPDIISAVGYATPPCVSRELAESCSDFVTTVVMQDDIVPRLSAASLIRLRNEILQTDWITVFEKEDWKGVIDLVTNAKQVVSSVQDVARKLAEYAKLRGQTKHSEMLTNGEVKVVQSIPQTPNPSTASHDILKGDKTVSEVPELYVPGTLYYLKKNVVAKSHGRSEEFFTLCKRQPGENFQRILLSSNIISDHKCDSHYYALRDVLKGLPVSLDDRNLNQ